MILASHTPKDVINVERWWRDCRARPLKEPAVTGESDHAPAHSSSRRRDRRKRTPHHKRHRAGQSAEPRGVHVLNPEAGGGDRSERVTREVATGAQPWPQPAAVKPPLHRSDRGTGGQDVLEEAQLPAGPQDASQLGKRLRLVIHRAEHERCDREIKRVRLVWRDGSGLAGDDAVGVA